MATSAKPNILFIMADDIGWFNVSAYNLRCDGLPDAEHRPDRPAGRALFTDFYGQQSCTAGRAAFITGQAPIRTGLAKVGMPGATLGLSAEDPSVAQFLKGFGYATGQFGKNHLGDRNEHLPTVHGFDEFFGNLYHLNAEEEPEYENYPQGPGVPQEDTVRVASMKCRPSDKDDRHRRRAVRNRSASRRSRTPGPLTRKRMETVDEEFIGAAARLHGPQDQGEGAPWFCYFNPPGCTVFTHLKESSRGKTGPGLYPERDGRARWLCGPAACRSSTTSASPTTRSSSSRPTTARRS